MFRKYAAILQENTHAEMWLQFGARSLAACAQKPTVPGSGPAASYAQSWALCSNRPTNV